MFFFSPSYLFQLAAILSELINKMASNSFDLILHLRYMRVQISKEGLNQKSFSAWEKNN